MKGFSLLEVLLALPLISMMILISDFALTKAATLNAKISKDYSEIFKS